MSFFSPDSPCLSLSLFLLYFERQPRRLKLTPSWFSSSSTMPWLPQPHLRSCLAVFYPTLTLIFSDLHRRAHAAFDRRRHRFLLSPPVALSSRAAETVSTSFASPRYPLWYPHRPSLWHVALPSYSPAPPSSFVLTWLPRCRPRHGHLNPLPTWLTSQPMWLFFPLFL